MTNINAVSELDVKLFAERPLMHEYQRLATRSAIYPGRGTPLGLNYAALKLNGEAGELAEHVGKAMRDDDLIHVGGSYSDATFAVKFNDLTPERRAAIIKEAGDVLWYVSAIANELGMKLSEIATANLVKLADRTKRNVLQGSGDER
jgi:NTP pyrophosphatase (non-canonical NTP hydrolase)